jgi:hypothetical protein
MVISIAAAASSDAAEILALQKAACQSEATLYDDWTIPPLTQTLSQLVAEFDRKVLLKAVENALRAHLHPIAVLPMLFPALWGPCPV